jgi:hypothetical protein
MTHGCRAGTVAELMEGMAVYRDMPVWVPDIWTPRSQFAEAQCDPDPPAAPKRLRLGRRPGHSVDLLGRTGRRQLLVVLGARLSPSSWPAGLRLFDPAVMKRVRPIDLHMADYPKTPIQRWRQPPTPPGPASAGFFTPIEGQT